MSSLTVLPIFNKTVLSGKVAKFNAEHLYETRSMRVKEFRISSIPSG